MDGIEVTVYLKIGTCCDVHENGSHTEIQYWNSSVLLSPDDGLPVPCRAPSPLSPSHPPPVLCHRQLVKLVTTSYHQGPGEGSICAVEHR